MTNTTKTTLRAAIFDWAGTTVDYGCIAPTVVFRAVFAARGVEISIEEARAPMGLEKRAHIRTITQMPDVTVRWADVHRRPPTEDDVLAMYESFTPMQIGTLTDYADLIPGTIETLATCRARGMRIGSTTGYSRAMMDVLQPVAAQRGYAPDVCICPDEAPAGRPAPWMCMLNAMELNVYPMRAFVKVGDTLPDIAEGLNAGMWTVAVTQSGNEFGLSAGEIAALDRREVSARNKAIEQRMRAAGAHYVIATIADLPPILDAIDARLERGEQPS